MTLYGYSIESDTINVNRGWNMIGSISSPVAVSSITSNPPGMVASNFFGYSGGYSLASSIVPGSAYWVKVNQSGELILANSSQNISTLNRIRIIPTGELPPPAPGQPTMLDPAMPKEFSLQQNYPNPFNPATVIRFQLPVSSTVTLRIYNVLGQEVKSLVNGEFQEAGFKTVSFDASSLSSGVYFYRMQAGGFTDIKKMLLVK